MVPSNNWWGHPLQDCYEVRRQRVWQHYGFIDEKLDSLLWSDESFGFWPRKVNDERGCWKWTTTFGHHTTAWRSNHQTRRQTAHCNWFGGEAHRLDEDHHGKDSVRGWEMGNRDHRRNTCSRSITSPEHGDQHWWLHPIYVCVWHSAKRFPWPWRGNNDRSTRSPWVFSLDKACRLRQIALSAVQAAIMESRIARANKSRPQRTPVEEIQVGTTQVEIFRDDGGGHGWMLVPVWWTFRTSPTWCHYVMWGSSEALSSTTTLVPGRPLWQLRQLCSRRRSCGNVFNEK